MSKTGSKIGKSYPKPTSFTKGKETVQPNLILAAVFGPVAKEYNSLQTN